MSNFNIKRFLRPNILKLVPYRCARDDYSDGILLDANENALGHSISRSAANGVEQDDIDASFLDLDLHRYPDPYQLELKKLYSQFRRAPGPDHIFLGVGSDEIIDLIIRISCTPGQKEPSILLNPPTYGMYKVCANLNDVAYTSIPLYTTAEYSNLSTDDDKHFQLQVDRILEYLKSTAKPDSSDSSAPPVSPIKLIFVTSPGNPTGVSVPNEQLVSILECPYFNGLVVVDEAYLDFRDENMRPSGARLLEAPYNYPNVIALQTLSKAFGLAGIRLGTAIGHPDIIHALTTAKAPYSISSTTSALACRALSLESLSIYEKNVKTLLDARDNILMPALDDRGKTNDESSIAYKLYKSGVGKVFGPVVDANFIMVQILDKETCSKPDSARAQKVYTHMAEEKGVVVRYRGSEYGCEGCLRVTVGSPDECRIFLEKLLSTLERI